MKQTILALMFLLFAISPTQANVVDNVDSRTVTISSGESLSESVGFSTLRLVGIETPSTWTAADLTFQVSTDGGQTWKNKYDDQGNEYTVIGTENAYVDVDEYGFDSVTYLKVRSGTSTTPVNQAGDRTVKLILRP